MLLFFKIYFYHNGWHEPRVYWFIQVVAGSIVPPGHGGLRKGGHIDTVGAQPTLLRPGEKMQFGWNRVSVAGHRVHHKHADHRP